MVPGRHLLASPPEPVHCEPKSKRALERALLPSLRGEYAREGLCPVIIYRTQASPTCQPAPGTVAPFLFGPGSPGFGLAPDGVGGVVLHFRAGLARRARVRHNFWIVNDSTLLARPCGLDWTRASGIVLRTVATCNRGHHVSGGLGALRGTCVDLWLLSSHNLHDVPVGVAASAEDGKRCPRKPQLTFADSREPRRPTI